MPGIFGLVTPDFSELRTSLTKMANLLQPSQIRNSNLWVKEEKGVGLGFQGVDYFTHNSKCAYFNNRYSIVMYGEVIGQDEIRVVDPNCVHVKGIDNIAQKLLLVFLTGGFDGLKKINGNFSLAIWDDADHRLIICPDRYGLQPIFYTHKPGRIAFASEIKALLSLPWIDPAIDDAAAMEMITMDMVGFDRTYIKSIKRLPFGNVLIYQEGKIKVDDRWSPHFHLPDKQRSDEDYLDEFIALSKKGVTDRLSDQRIGISLSGGLDSRFLLGLAIINNLLPVCITYGTRNSRDIAGGTSAARTVKAKHIRLVLRDDYLYRFASSSIERAEGFFNAFNCHAMVLISVSEICPVLAFGNGIDQLLYTTRSEYDLMTTEPIFEAFFQNRNNYIPEKEWADWFTPNWLKKVGSAVREQFYNDMLHFSADCIDNQLDSYMLNYLANTTISGFPTISQSLGYTAPFFDHELVNFCLGLPVRLRWRRELEVAALRKISPALAYSIGGTKDGEPSAWKWQKFIKTKIRHGLFHLGFIPPAILKPPSATYTDLHNLLRKPVNQRWIKELLLSPSLLDRGIFRREMLEKALGDHFSGKRNYTKQFSTIATFELTMRNVVEKYTSQNATREAFAAPLKWQAEPFPNITNMNINFAISGRSQ